MPEHVTTEWGVNSPWGFHPTADQAAARRTVHNMREAGHEATVVWRGITAWQEEEPNV